MILWAATALLFMGLCSVVLLWAERASNSCRVIVADDAFGDRALLGAGVDYAILKGELAPAAKRAANNLKELALSESVVASTFHHATAKTSFKFAQTRAQNSRALSGYDVAGEKNCVLSSAGNEIATIRKAAESLAVTSQIGASSHSRKRLFVAVSFPCMQAEDLSLIAKERFSSKPSILKHG
jgi:hypothetical protein